MGVDIRLQLVTMLPRLRRFAVSLSRNRDLADDLVQATCERALRGAAGWQPGTRLDSWLYRIMQNLWIDDMRKRRSHGDEIAIEDRHDLVGEEGGRSAEARLAAAEVMRALDALPEEQRSVVTLVCVEDLSYREVSEVLEIPLGTVMSRLSRGRLALARQLGLGEGGAISAIGATS